MKNAETSLGLPDEMRQLARKRMSSIRDTDEIIELLNAGADEIDHMRLVFTAAKDAPMRRLLTNRPELGVCDHGTDRSTDWCAVCDRDLFPAVDALPASECKYVCKCGTHHAKEPMYCVHRFESQP